MSRDPVSVPPFAQIVDADTDDVYRLRTHAPGPSGRLPLTEEQVLRSPSGDLFAYSQNAGMGWEPDELDRPNYLILSTLGGTRAPDGSPIALGYHTGHWELDRVGRAHWHSSADYQEVKGNDRLQQG